MTELIILDPLIFIAVVMAAFGIGVAVGHHLART